jgi:hypothetical protein
MYLARIGTLPGREERPGTGETSEVPCTGTGGAEKKFTAGCAAVQQELF